MAGLARLFPALADPLAGLSLLLAAGLYGTSFPFSVAQHRFDAATQPACAQPEGPRLVATYAGSGKGIGPVRFSPDGRTLAIADGDDHLVLWEVAARQVRAKFELPGGLIPQGSVAFTPDGKGLATAGYGSRPQLWDLPTGRTQVLRVQQEREVDRIRCMAISPDGKMLALGDGKGTVRLWDAAAARELGTLHGKEFISHLAFSPDGKTLAACGGSPAVPAFGRVWLWEVAGRRLRTTIEYGLPPECLAFSPDGQTLAIGGSGGDAAVQARDGDTVQLRDPASGRLRASWKFGSSLVALTFSQDGRILIAGGGLDDVPGVLKGSGEVKFWDVASQKEILALRAHEDQLLWLALSPDGRLLAVSTGKPGLPMNLWDVSAITARGPAAPKGKK